MLIFPPCELPILCQMPDLWHPKELLKELKTLRVYYVDYGKKKKVLFFFCLDDVLWNKIL